MKCVKRQGLQCKKRHVLRAAGCGGRAARRQRCVLSGERIWHVGGSGFVVMGLDPVYSKHVPVWREYFCVIPGAGLSASSSTTGGEEEKLRYFRCPQYTTCWLPCSTFSSRRHPVWLVWTFRVTCSVCPNCFCFLPSHLKGEASDGFQTRSICLYLNMFIRLNPLYCI